MKSKHRFFALAVIALAGLATTGLARQQEPIRSIINVTGDLYRGQDNAHFTVFLVTPDGIILSDPINTGFATWLKAELDSRFDVPVRYVLYSHSDGDHASGGAVFADHVCQFLKQGGRALGIRSVWPSITG